MLLNKKVNNNVDVNIVNEKNKGTLYGAMQGMLYNDYWINTMGYKPEVFLNMLFEKHGSTLDRYKA